MKKRELDGYLAKPYTRMLVPDADGGFAAEILEWPGCLGEGETADEAMIDLEQSMETWLEVMLKDGRPIPEPLERDFSGRLALRLPRDVHRRVTVRAQLDGVSINQFIVGAIEGRLGAQHAAAIPAAVARRTPTRIDRPAGRQKAQ